MPMLGSLAAGSLKTFGLTRGGSGPTATGGQAVAVYPSTASGTGMTNTGAGTFEWTCPAGVTSISILCVGGGASGGTGAGPNYGEPGGGGGGGGTAWINDVAVNPGSTYTVIAGANAPINTNWWAAGTDGSESYFSAVGVTDSTGAIIWAGGGKADVDNTGGPGGTIAASTSYGTYGGGNGGRGGIGGFFPGAGGGGAGGYAGDGGAGANGDGSGTGGWNGYDAAAGSGGGGGGGGTGGGNGDSGGGGGGVGLLGIGATGTGGLGQQTDVTATGGTGGSGGTTGQAVSGWYNSSARHGGYGGTYGGGGGSSAINHGDEYGGAGGPGAVRIIWATSGTRAFPSTNTIDV